MDRPVGSGYGLGCTFLVPEPVEGFFSSSSDINCEFRISVGTVGPQPAHVRETVR